MEYVEKQDTGDNLWASVWSRVIFLSLQKTIKNRLEDFQQTPS